MNGLCSHERLELALAGTLNADEESTLSLHLEDCELCAAEMERLSGGEQASREIAALLVPDEFDDALPLREECSTADFVVDHLEPSDDPAVLGRLGGYDVLDIIGRGGMGVVLKGFDRELKRFVAIKALAPHLAHSALARKRFGREAQAAAAVVNLHVIAIHQVQPNGQLPFLVMPLLTGESLAQRIKTRGTLELREILRIGMQAAEGLAAAHGQGLVHRDVKPANILLEKGVERAVLTDFGLARAADDVSMTRQGVVAGTPEYMSPEQARGEALDGRSDLFSMGCVLYEMATGVSPFRTDSTMATLRRIVDEQPAAMASLVPELPPWFCHIVERLLSKDPAQRFASASEVSQLLEQCLSHLQQPTSVPLPASLVPHATRRRSMFNVTRKGMTAIALLGIFGLTWLGMFLMSASEPPRIADQWVGEDWGVVVLTSNKPGEYEGSFTGTVPDKAGTMQLKWSRLEKRFNGTWQEGDHRRGKISIRVVDGEIHGAWTTTKSERPKVVPQLPEIKSEDTQPGTTRLGDLLWERPAKIQETEYDFGGERFGVRLNAKGAILDSGTPSILLIRTVVDDRPSSQGKQRVAEMIDRAGNERLKFASGSRLKIGNHAVTILFVGENFVIVESDGRWKRWNVDQDFADAVVLGPKLRFTKPVTENSNMGSSGTVDVEHFRRVLRGQETLSNDETTAAHPPMEPSTEGGVDVADESLEGVWELALPPDIAAKRPEDLRLRLVIAGEWQGTFRGDQRVSASRLTVEPQHTPKRLSFVDVEGRRMRGIYEVKEDGLRLSIAPDTEALPAKFGTEHPEFKRVKGKLAEEQLAALKKYSVESTVPGTRSDSPEGSKSRRQPPDRETKKDVPRKWPFKDNGTLTQTRPHESRIPVRAKLLVVKRDWSNADEVKPQDGIRKSLPELPNTPVSRAARVRIAEAGSLGPDDLVSNLGLPSVFGAEDFASLQSWLRDQGLLLGELPVEQKAEPRTEERWTSRIDLSEADVAGVIGKWSLSVIPQPAITDADEQGIFRVVNHPYLLAFIHISRTQQVMESQPGGPRLRGASLSTKPKFSFYLPKKRVIAIDWDAPFTGKEPPLNQARGSKVILVFEDAEVPEPRSTVAGFRLPERIGSLLLDDENRWLYPPDDLGDIDPEVAAARPEPATDANDATAAKHPPVESRSAVSAARNALLQSERDMHPPFEFRIATTKADRDADGVVWFPIVEPRIPAPAGKSGANVPIEEKLDDKWRGLLWGKTEHTLLSDGTWRVVNCDVVRSAQSIDLVPSFDIQIKLGAVGGALLRRLTATHLNQSLAVVVEGTIVAAPIIRSEFGEDFVITGNFSKADAEQLAAAIRKPDPRKRATFGGVADAKTALAALKDEAVRRKLRGFEATIDARLNSIAITAADADTLKALKEILDRLDTP